MSGRCGVLQISGGNTNLSSRSTRTFQSVVSLNIKPLIPLLLCRFASGLAPARTKFLSMCITVVFSGFFVFALSTGLDHFSDVIQDGVMSPGVSSIVKGM